MFCKTRAKHIILFFILGVIMQAYVHEFGKGLGIRIPDQIAKQLHFDPGCPVTLIVENGRLIVQPPQYNLDTMLEGIASDNQQAIALDLLMHRL